VSQHRKDLRDAASAALRVAARFAGATEMPSWVQSVDAATLPAWSVMTAREQSQAAAKDLLDRRVELVVTVKRPGADGLDDEMDLDAEEIEAALAGVLEPHCLHAELSETRLAMSGEGAQRVGQLTLRWTCVVHTDI
jgi:hypothetical protein